MDSSIPFVVGCEAGKRNRLVVQKQGLDWTIPG